MHDWSNTWTGLLWREYAVCSGADIDILGLPPSVVFAQQVTKKR
jgi:hypothetical protein